MNDIHLIETAILNFVFQEQKTGRGLNTLEELHLIETGSLCSSLVQKAAGYK